MGRTELVRRYLVFILAMAVAGLGIALVTRALLGVNSVACFSYVSSVYFPVTMGIVTIIFNLVTLIGQLFILGRDGIKEQLSNLLMQIPAFFCIGIFVDFWIFVTRGLTFDSYILAFVCMVFGNAIIALNISIQATANVTMLSCDAFVRLLAAKIGRKLGTVKLWFDLIVITLAGCMSFCCSGFTEIVGIREGTVIGALIVGPLAQIFLRYTGFFNTWALKARKERATDSGK